MQNYLVQLYRGPAKQSEPLAGREQEMVRNSNDGYVFPVTDWVRLERFLVLGAEGGGFYARERELSLENAQAVKRAIAEDGLRAVRMIVTISESAGRRRTTPALFALAMAASFGDERTRRAAFRSLPLWRGRERTCSASRPSPGRCADGAAGCEKRLQAGTSPATRLGKRTRL